ncbi:PilZ domain-containing protein [Bradyrhizobium diazoefficiens]|nr:PilZ domain-containing protein [Bradyrhizobium diazoefficiens]MBR0774205.1 PilZ domain-containing protein [Bradyrhizobium diazoefficiens]MBR0846375.1 PilZ domain-containing protein [Bradyrhizobium diazoefficiens]
MIERRALERTPLNQLALVVFDGIPGVHPATVRNISAAGACISIPHPFFASEFKLSFDGFHRTIVCRVVWKGEGMYGVSFVSGWCGHKVGTHA